MWLVQLCFSLSLPLWQQPCPEMEQRLPWSRAGPAGSRGVPPCVPVPVSPSPAATSRASCAARGMEKVERGEMSSLSAPIKNPSGREGPARAPGEPLGPCGARPGCGSGAAVTRSGAMASAPCGDTLGSCQPQPRWHRAHCAHTWPAVGILPHGTGVPARFGLLPGCGVSLGCGSGLWPAFGAEGDGSYSKWNNQIEEGKEGLVGLMQRLGASARPWCCLSVQAVPLEAVLMEFPPPFGHEARSRAASRCVGTQREPQPSSQQGGLAGILHLVTAAEVWNWMIPAWSL